MEVYKPSCLVEAPSRNRRQAFTKQLSVANCLNQFPVEQLFRAARQAKCSKPFAVIAPGFFASRTSNVNRSKLARQLDALPAFAFLAQQTVPD